eukprot:1117-Heterococcus_DN1.PRE.5
MSDAKACCYGVVDDTEPLFLFYATLKSWATVRQEQQQQQETELNVAGHSSSESQDDVCMAICVCDLDEYHTICDSLHIRRDKVYYYT